MCRLFRTFALRSVLGVGSAILLSAPVAAQEEEVDTLTALCRAGDIQQLMISVDSIRSAYQKGDHHYAGQIHKERAREIIPGYWERMFSWIVWEYHVLSDSASILAFRVVDRDGTIEENWSDEARMSELDQRYRAQYGVPLRPSELFCDTIVYSTWQCGRAPRPPKYRRLMEGLVAAADTTTLNRWITSPNTEMQLYAVEAFGQLRDEGCTLSPEQRRLMNVVLQKKGTIHYCGGCRHSDRNIQDFPFH